TGIHVSRRRRRSGVSSYLARARAKARGSVCSRALSGRSSSTPAFWSVRAWNTQRSRSIPRSYRIDPPLVCHTPPESFACTFEVTTWTPRAPPLHGVEFAPLFEHACEGMAESGGRSAMSIALQSEDREQRLSRARAALGAAERSAARWGGRIDRTALRTSPQSAAAAADGGLGTRRPGPGPRQAPFPRGSLRAGSSVALEGAASTSLLLALAVAAAGEDSWCAIAGMTDLGLRSAMDAGLDPCRLALAPAGGEQRPQVLSALVD